MLNLFSTAVDLRQISIFDVRIWLLLCGTMILVSCQPNGSTESQSVPFFPSDQISVMSFDLNRYGMDDRDGDGQKNNPKPQAEQQAVVKLISKVNPDILAVQEIGDPAAFEAFQRALKNVGIEYEFTEYLETEQSTYHLAMLSRFPIMSSWSHKDDRYSMGDANVLLTHGIIDVDIGVNPGYEFKLMVAHLKSKEFHPLGQTEMRRNEARLLNKHMRRALKKIRV